MRSRRAAFFGLVVGTTLVGLAMMLEIVRADGVSALEILILALFAVTFGWITIAFWNAVAGFLLLALGRDPLTLAARGGESPPTAAPTGRTALVMPAHNEHPVRVMGGLEAMVRSLDRTPWGDRFDVHLLSDTTDPAVASLEEEAWTALTARIGRADGMHYRRRTTNSGRKAGNIAEFCARCGHLYDFMVVLDADSLMSATTLIELVREMEADPSVGLIQTVPLPHGQTTLFGRLVQFAAWLSSPMLAAGQSFWQADAANYWGHNAIVRLAAFHEHCELPVLPGRPPLGGEILSHDFVEAALLRRAGWKVRLAAHLEGSYEEVPGDVLSYAKRDRRWAQGSLQHLRLLGLRGWHPLSRVHFLLGAMGYVASVLWLLMLLAATAYVVVPQLSARPLARPGSLWGGAASPPFSLLGVTALILFLPKALALGLALARKRRAFGGAPRLLVGAVLETAFSVIAAPLMMMFHTRFVASILAGRDIVWEPQLREGPEIGWSEALRRTAGFTAVGLAWAGVTLYHSPAFLLWLSPILAGLVLSGPLVCLTSRRTTGVWLRDRGLLLVPRETELSTRRRVTSEPRPQAPDPRPSWINTGPAGVLAFGLASPETEVVSTETLSAEQS